MKHLIIIFIVLPVLFIFSGCNSQPLAADDVIEMEPVVSAPYEEEIFEAVIEEREEEIPHVAAITEETIIAEDDRLSGGYFERISEEIPAEETAEIEPVTECVYEREQISEIEQKPEVLEYIEPVFESEPQRMVEVLPTPQPAVQPTPQQVYQPAPQPRVQSNTINQIANIRNTNIIGTGTLNVDGVIDYIRVRNRNPVLNEANLRRLITLYIDEAAIEEVNHDIAIAQMLFWTAFLSNRQRVENHNFAGLSRTQEWHGRFQSMQEGVKAHIQHLRGYARSSLVNPNTVIVNPRWNNIQYISGTVNTFEQLYHVWTQNTDRYRLNISIILSNLYRYCDARR